MGEVCCCCKEGQEGACQQGPEACSPRQEACCCCKEGQEGACQEGPEACSPRQEACCCCKEGQEGACQEACGTQVLIQALPWRGLHKNVRTHKVQASHPSSKCGQK